MKNVLLLMFLTLISPIQAQRSDFKEIDFTNANLTADRYKGEELTNLPLLTYHLTSHLKTDVERFRSIYIWITHNIRGNYDLVTKNDRKRYKLRNDPDSLAKWNHQFKKEVFKRLLNDKETLCTGYAYLVKAMSNLAGLECQIIHGYGLANDVKSNIQNTPNHSWNAIKLDEKWYVCDATWSSGYTDMSTFLFEFDFDESFFLMTPVEFAKSHSPIDTKWTLITQNSVINKTKHIQSLEQEKSQ